MVSLYLVSLHRHISSIPCYSKTLFSFTECSHLGNTAIWLDHPLATLQGEQNICCACGINLSGWCSLNRWFGSCLLWIGYSKLNWTFKLSNNSLTRVWLLVRAQPQQLYVSGCKQEMLTNRKLSWHSLVASFSLQEQMNFKGSDDYYCAYGKIWRLDEILQINTNILTLDLLALIIFVNLYYFSFSSQSTFNNKLHLLINQTTYDDKRIQ